MTTTPGSGGTAPSADALAATIASVVERQLSQYLATIHKQVEGVRESSAATITSLQHELEQRITGLVQRLESQQQSAESYQRALQTALEERLQMFAAHQQARLDDLDRRVQMIPAGGVDATELAALRDHLDAQTAAAHSRIDDLHKATRRFDEQAAAMVQHVNDTTIALSQRMDEGNQMLAAAVEERLVIVRNALSEVGQGIQRQLSEQSQAVAQRIEAADNGATDRMLAMEARINEQQGTRLAELEATLGRIGGGFDASITAMSHRLLELDDRIAGFQAALDGFDQRLKGIDQSGLDDLKQQMSSAVGEAMLVRIELDRAVGDMAEKLDKANVRMAEIESLLSDEMDVNASVQLERLDELERALAELDPDRFAPSAARLTAAQVPDRAGTAQQSAPPAAPAPRWPAAPSAAESAAPTAASPSATPDWLPTSLLDSTLAKIPPSAPASAPTLAPSASPAPAAAAEPAASPTPSTEVPVIPPMPTISPGPIAARLAGRPAQGDAPLEPRLPEARQPEPDTTPSE